MQIKIFCLLFYLQPSDLNFNCKIFPRTTDRHRGESVYGSFPNRHAKMPAETSGIRSISSTHAVYYRLATSSDHLVMSNGANIITQRAKLKCRRCWLTPGRPKCHKCCTALCEQREKKRKRSLFCWRPAAEAPNLYSLYWREAAAGFRVCAPALSPGADITVISFLFIPSRPHADVKFNQVNSFGALAAPLGRERNWELASPCRATLIGFCCSHCGREANPISYVIMRQNSFLLAWSREPSPSIEIPAARCWFNFRLRDELARACALHQRAH